MLQTKNQLKNYRNQPLENLKKEKYTHPIQIIFCGADLADVQLISKFNKGFRFLLCVIDIFSKYAWIIPLKDKKGTTIKRMLDESNRKPNKLWVNKGREFYNISMRSWLERNVFNT